MIVGDVGTLIELDAGEDLSSGSQAKIYYKKPRGETGNWTAVIDDTKITYTTVSEDIDQAGEWTVQGFVNLGLWQGRTEATSLTVNNKVGE